MSQLLYNPDTLTVLVVDDHDPIRKAIRRVLQSMHFNEVIEAFDGSDAIKTLSKKPVDLIICDLYMRTVNGFKVLEHIRNRQIGSDIPIIIVTGEGSKEEIVKTADLGADDYVLKPFQANDLEKKVTNVLNRYYSPTPLLRAIRKAERMYFAKDFTGALVAFDEAMRIDRESMRASHGKALTLAKLKQHEEAINLLQETIRLNHSYHRNYGALADIYLAMGRQKEAMNSMKRELAINPKQTRRQIQLAKMLLKEGDAMGAIDHYRHALRDNPKNKSALMGMGHALAMVENLDKSIYYFKRIRRYHPTTTKALEAAVRHALSAGEPKKAEMMLRDEKASHPDREDTYIVLAQFYFHREETELGVKTLNELLKKNPEHRTAHMLLGRTHLRERQWGDAVLHFDIVAKTSPSHDVLNLLAEAHIGAGNHVEALEILNRATSLGTENSQTLLLLGRVHMATAQWTKAYYFYRRAARCGAQASVCQGLAKQCFEEIQRRRMGQRAAS